MRIFSNLSLSLLAASSLALTGCQQFTKPQLDPNTIQTESDQHFSLQGKMWGADGKPYDCKAVMPESTFARTIKKVR